MLIFHVMSLGNSDRITADREFFDGVRIASIISIAVV